MTFLRYNWYAIIWSIFILIVTLIPGENIPEVDVIEIDKAVHFFIFGLLMFLSCLGLRRYASRARLHLNTIPLAFAYNLSLGVVIEILQNFVPGRSMSMIDMIANTIGVFLGYWLFSLYMKRYFS